MLSVLLAANVADGHVAPMLGVAEHFVGAGHRVRFLSGDRFADDVRRVGAEFVPWPAEAQVDHQEMLAETRGGARGLKSMAIDVETIFVAPGRAQYEAVRAAVDAEPTDAILTEFSVLGVAAIAWGSAPHPPIVACGILPLGLSSVDAAPFGPGVLPRRDAVGRMRNRLLNRVVRHVLLRRPQKLVERLIADVAGAKLDVFFMDWAVRADHYAQFTVPSFEYPRRDLPANVSFVGPVGRSASVESELPAWWGDLDGRTVVHVSQGTVANHDLGELVRPTIEALAGEDVLVVATTGGPPVADLGPLPANARAAEFVPYSSLMPLTDVFVSNGGYGGLHIALGHGIPMVVAGDTEDKPETTRRVEWSGVGINLHTGRPSPAAIRDAVRRVLAEPQYRQRAESIAHDITASPGPAGLEQVVLNLAR